MSPRPRQSRQTALVPISLPNVVPPTTRGGKELCVYCNHVAERKRALCKHCGKRPPTSEARSALLGLAGVTFCASVLAGPWSGLMFGLSALFFGSGLYLFARNDQKMSDYRRVFLPLAAVAYGLIPVVTGSPGALALAILATGFTYAAIPSLHSPASDDLSKSIEEFEAQNQLKYGFGEIREQIRLTIEASEGVKHAVLTKDLQPRIDSLLDHRLLSSLKRKVSLERILATTDPARLEEDRRKAVDRAALIKSDKVRGELARSAALSKSMIENYQKIAELLNVYNVQIRNVQKVLLNLNMKIATMAFDDSGLGALREPLDALDQEMQVMEESFRDFDITFTM